MLIEYNVDIEYVKVLMRGIVLINDLHLLKDILGFYKTPIFISDNSVRAYNGVCDSLENLLEFYPELLYEGEGCREFIVFMYAIIPGYDDVNLGGYCGSKISQTAYILDTHTEILFSYHIYERYSEFTTSLGWKKPLVVL